MAAAWFVILLVLLPGVAAAQFAITPRPLGPDPNVIINPRTAPPSTIPSAPELSPELRLPVPPPGVERPTKTFEFRPTLSLIEEYTDNFDRAAQDTISNLRSSITPGFIVLLDRGVLTGQGSYRLLAFHDSSSQDFGTHHQLAANLAWQATSRLKFTLAETFVQSDEPSQADRLDVSAGRRDFTRNLLSLGSEYSVGTIETKLHYRLSTNTSDDQTTTTHTMGGTGSIPLGQIHLLTVGYEYLHSKSTRENASAPSSSLVQDDSKTTGYELTGSFSREISANLTAGISASFADRTHRTATETNDFSRWQVGVFNTYIVPEKIVMRGSIGVAQLQSRTSNGKLLFTSNSSLLYWFGPALLSLTAEQGFSETFAASENFGVVETSAILGSLSYRFSPLLTAFVRGTYRENKFTGEGGGGRDGRKDETTSGILGVSYQVLNWLTATFDYTYTKTKSSDADASFTENRVRAALNAAF